jgi:hypothetical protein
VFTTSHDGTIGIWLPSGGPAEDVVSGDHGPLTGTAFSPDGLQGDPGDRLWWAMKLCRFGPGELDPHVPSIRRLPDDAPILPGLGGSDG